MPNEKKFAKRLALNIKCNKNRIRILDVGGGSGLVSYLLAKEIINRQEIEHIEIIIADFDIKSIEIETDKVSIKRHVGEINNELGKFDIILASAVLEHIKKPKSIIETIFQLLDDDGVFYTRTPYMVPFAIFLNKFGIPVKNIIIFPEHIHDFSKSFWDNVLKTFKINDCVILKSEPSYLENIFFPLAFIAFLISKLIRLPFLVFKQYPFIGGWQVYIKKVGLSPIVD